MASEHKMAGRGAACWCALLLLLVPVTAAPSTPSGSVISHGFLASFGAGTPQLKVSSNQTQVTVKDLADPIIVPARSGSTLPNKPFDFLHTITNRGNAPDRFPLKAGAVQAVLPDSGAPFALEFFEGSGVTPLPRDADGNQVAGPLPPGASLDLVLRVTPPPGSAGRVSSITVTATSALSASRSASLSDQLVVLAGEPAPLLRVAKSAGSSVVESGDIVAFSVQLENSGALALGHATLSDFLPRGLRYLKGSTLLDGSPFPDPGGAGQQLSWDLGSLDPGRTRTLSYRCTVSADAPVGAALNQVTGSGVTPGGATSVSLPAFATVRVRPSILGDRAMVLGRLFEDKNGNGIPDPGEPGVPGVRVYLEDGSFTFSDTEGKYSFTGLSAGNHVVKIDRSTLTRRLKPSPYNTAFAGVGWSQFVSVPFGGPARGDFALVDSGLAEEPAVPQAPALPPAPRSPEGTARGPVTRLAVSPERVDLPADGASILPVTVELLNAQGRRVAGEHTVTVTLSRGRIVEADRDPALPGHQLLVRDGVGVFRVRAPLVAGEDLVRVAGENGTAGKLDLYFSSQLRDWIVVGLGSLDLGGKAVSGHLEQISKEDRFDDGIYHEERLAFFARGKILGKYLLTAAYDSDKERRDGVFQYLDPEKYYPVYGDASEIGYEAQSRGKIYLKLEAGRSYLLAGDYRTDLSENEFSRYDRALNGVRVELNGERGSVKGFESRSEDSLIKDEVPGNGSSGYYFLSQKPVLENSERVRIEVRDRYHSERLISVVQKTRYADYTIDYNAGSILFKEPVPSLDQNLNPVTVVVNYQSLGGGAEHYVYGGRALLRGEGGSFFGGSAVVEEGATRNNTLLGLDAGVKLGDSMTLKGEGAVSDTLEKGRGSAWKVDLSARPLETLELGGYYRKVDAGFLNPSMTGNETGTEKYGGRLDYRGLSDTRLFAESFVQKDPLGSTLFGNQAGFLRKFSLWEGEGGFKRVEQDKEGVNGSSDLLYAGLRGPLTSRLDGVLRRDQLLSPSSVAEYQSRTFLKLDYKITEATRAFVTEEYQEGAPTQRQATRFGLESRLSDRMRLTTGYQLSSGAAGSSEQSSVDLNTKLLEREGFTLNSRSGYQLDNSLSGERGQAILGLNSRLEAARGVFLNSSLERVETVQGSGGTRTAFTLAGEYLRQQDLKLTGRYEIRTGPGETASLYGAGLAYRVNGSLTLLGKASFWDRDADAGHDLTLDGYLGGSFRPLAGNPLQLLALARYKEEHKGSIPGSDDTRSLILSAEPTYRLVRNWSAQGKYAGKVSWVDDAAGRSYQAYTDLVLAGVSYDLAERWEIACYLKLLNQYDTGQRSLGGVARAGYRVYRNVVLSAGYNYARLDDRDLTGESFQGQGPFVGVKMKFDEEMFETVQRSSVALSGPPPAAQPVALLPPAVTPVKPEPPPTPPRAPVPPEPPLAPVLRVSASRLDEPLRISGSAELFILLINGGWARLPSTAVTVGRERLPGPLELKGGKLARTLQFTTSVERPDLVKSWSLSILSQAGEPLTTLKGRGAPARRIAWNGTGEGSRLAPGGVYQYRLEVAYLDGSRFSTGPELFGVGRKDLVLLTLSGGAFIFDSAQLTAEAKRLLREAAGALRAHPQDKVVVEGHTDGIGTVAYNMDLSRRRCAAAADFLIHQESIAANRLVRRWYGKSRPVADNRTPDGRERNRRVELKADFQDSAAVTTKDGYRGAPFLVVNDVPVPVDLLGRFETSVPSATDRLRVSMGDSSGRALATSIELPQLELVEPAGTRVVRYGGAVGGVRVDSSGLAACRVSGRTAPGNTLVLDGSPVPLDGEGRFALELPLKAGEQTFGMVLRGAGAPRLINLRLGTRVQEPSLPELRP